MLLVMVGWGAIVGRGELVVPTPRGSVGEAPWEGLLEHVVGHREMLGPGIRLVCMGWPGPSWGGWSWVVRGGGGGVA